MVLLIPLWLLLIFIAPLERLVDAAVGLANAKLFHVATVLVKPNGSGDTSWAYAYHGLSLMLAVVATVVWSLVDRRRRAYPRAAYWLRTFLRYNLASAALLYGIIKIFALQMEFPPNSLLATPLGDLLPMRFAWMFIGYSTPYQVFCGVMEASAGVLLLYRRTVTLGLILATAAFINVVLLNLAYDVPVKLYAIQLVASCVVLLLWDAPRLANMLVLNRPVGGTTLYDPPSLARWQRVGRGLLKVGFVMTFGVYASYDSWQKWRRPVVKSLPFEEGVY